ncbi:FGGY-family carbohydrate kinase [Geomicrobium sp. JCM 19055]|uniref:FGGY-family carbohydrate kinase n=1 Tax=Geomicrobium sp. JCM 19055 TaxID=1460649 RepID=UPI00045ED855|nr:FGGY-family carbohydrate kinase [Geomicrobium sp. JCM 19055]GAJ98135.1 xylulose kinase [Geomicrobium sp. JCM 19055]
MMNFEQQQWEKSWLVDVGLDPMMLPELHSAGKVVGVVQKHNRAGFNEKTAVLCGTGDAAASSLGAGVLIRGTSYLYIGSTGWTAFSTDRKNELYEGAFKLPHLDDVHFLSIAPMLNAGNVHRFAVELLCDGDYGVFESSVHSLEPSLDHPYFLPYVHGERFPVHDANATGSWSNLKATTSKAALCFSVLEGLSLSIRQLMTNSGEEKPTEIIVIGGGTKSHAWCQMLADSTGITICVPDNAEWLPVVGAASLGGRYLNWTNSYDEWSKAVIARLGQKRYEPNQTFAHLYNVRYREFVKIYPKIMQQ